MIWVLLTISSSALLAQQPLRTISEVVFQPQRIATHGDGEILVTETRRNTVQRLAADGQPLESFQVEHPLAVGVDAQGRILIGHGTRVDAFDGPQIVYTLGRGEGEFGKPSDLVVLPDGRILVTDCSNHVVRSYSADGTALGVIGAPGSGNGEFQFPTGIAVNSQRGEVYVADQGNARIQVFDLSGAFLRAFGRFTCQGPDGWVFEGTFTRIQGIAVDAANRIYVADSYQNNIQILSATGAFLGFLDLDDQGRHLFSLPCDLAVAGNNLFVVSTASSEISVFALDGLAADPDADTPETVESYFLSQNYPNPFNPETHIRFSLPVAGHVTLTILDVLGREVVRLVDGARAAGNHTVTWNGYSASGSAASSGVYFCQLRVTNGAGTIAHSSQRKMVLLK